MTLYVAAYDVSESRSRRAVAKVLRAYGERIQRSVFEIRIEPRELSELLRRVGPHLAPSDCFDVVPVDERPATRRMRWQRDPLAWDDVLLA